ncbi:MAG: hypothetical protein U0821_26125 [Chloroflexota bacterium]
MKRRDGNTPPVQRTTDIEDLKSIFAAMATDPDQASAARSVADDEAADAREPDACSRNNADGEDDDASPPRPPRPARRLEETLDIYTGTRLYEPVGKQWTELAGLLGRMTELNGGNPHLERDALRRVTRATLPGDAYLSNSGRVWESEYDAEDQPMSIMERESADGHITSSVRITADPFGNRYTLRLHGGETFEATANSIQLPLTIESSNGAFVQGEYDLRADLRRRVTRLHQFNHEMIEEFAHDGLHRLRRHAIYTRIGGNSVRFVTAYSYAGPERTDRRSTTWFEPANEGQAMR